jgi:hypothetical protein
VVLLAAWKEHIDLTRLFLDKDPLHTTLVIDWLRTLRPMGWPVERSGAERVRRSRFLCRRRNEGRVATTSVGDELTNVLLAERNLPWGSSATTKTNPRPVSSWAWF